MPEAPRPEEVKKRKPEERRLPVHPPPDERRWWEMQLGVRRVDRLYTGTRSGR